MPAGLYHENYRSDERIFQTWFVRIWLIAFLLVCALFPLFASKYMISTMIEVGIAIIACHGLNLLTGFTAFPAVEGFISGDGDHCSPIYYRIYNPALG
jgi:branched-chain amino acid transport system permease protein